ncbi:MAG: TonB-dependent receptor [Candidatus Symbiothrix sp.]|jgi:TonB-linked SusC/RagA family outer membrane protein|nr:TonB-dependent receptor [Candidatus Symbiothrix sp.]
MKNIINSKLIKFLILFLFIPLGLAAQNVSVNGSVRDKSGETLPGATVTVKGTATGTVTDFDGNYSVSVPNNNAVLVFSYLGYLDQEITVGSRRTIDVTLLEDSKTLDEVVVVGYGTMKRKDLTGSVASINSDAISKSVSTSIDQVLAGRAAGVQVQQNSGAPGASTSIRIRGINSLNASTEPIFVIDGVIIQRSLNAGAETNPLATINPADIVSMDILKDASATAIYGAQASNGVIIINTKRGKKGEAIVTYNGYVGWQQLPKHLDVLNLQQYAEIRTVKAEYGQVRPNNNFVRPDLLGKGTDWQNELFNTAMMQNHNLSISGGSENSTYNLGAGYSNQDGIAEGSGFRRLSLSGSFDAQAKEWLRAGINFGFSNTNQKLTVSDESLILMAIRSTPDVPIHNADGTYGAPEGSSMPSNPIARASIIDNHQYNSGARANTFVEIAPDKLLKGLSYRTEFSFDLNFYNNYLFTPTYHIASWDFRDVSEKTDTKQYNVYYSWRNILTYDQKFDVHEVKAMLGHEMSKSTWDNLSGTRSGLPTNGATDLAMGTKIESTTGRTGANSLLSYFGRLYYSYNDRYLLTTTLRRDGSSKFAPKNRWGWFPSAALAWRVSEESFLNDNPAINNLKLRVGWGLVGNQNIPNNNAWLPVYQTVLSPWSGGLRPVNTPNEDLVWESTNSANIGFDLSLLHNRLDFIVDFYLKRTNNLLMEASLPAFVGTSGAGAAGPPWVNLGSLENKGLEITLNTVNIESKNFQWNTNFVFSLNRNKVRSLNTATGDDNRSATDYVWGESGTTVVNRTVVGQPIGQFFGYEVIGRFEKATDLYRINDKGEVVRTPVTTNANGLLPIDEKEGVWIGDYIYRDRDGNGEINASDKTFIGNPEPKFSYGINNNFTYKKWDLGIQLVGMYGNDIVNYPRRYMDNPYYNNSNLFVEALDYAKLELIDPNLPNDYRNVKIVGGDPFASRMAQGRASSMHNTEFSDRFVEDGSYLRIQNISLGYNFPKQWLQKGGIGNVKLYANLQNLYTFTKYRGFDPEIGISGGLTGVDTGRYPSPRIYTIGANITF